MFMKYEKQQLKQKSTKWMKVFCGKSFPTAYNRRGNIDQLQPLKNTFKAYFLFLAQELRHTKDNCKLNYFYKGNIKY